MDRIFVLQLTILLDVPLAVRSVYRTRAATWAHSEIWPCSLEFLTGTKAT